MLETLKVLKEQNIEHGTIEFIITVGERCNWHGRAKALIAPLWRLNSVLHLIVMEKWAYGCCRTYAGESVRNNFRPRLLTLVSNQRKAFRPLRSQPKQSLRMPLGRWIDEETTANIGRSQGTANAILFVTMLKSLQKQDRFDPWKNGNTGSLENERSFRDCSHWNGRTCWSWSYRHVSWF